MSMCSDWDTACAYGHPIHLRCIPQHGGSAEGTCELVSDCSSEFAGSPPAERVCAASECASNAIGCVVGSPEDVTCVKDTPTSEYCHADYACR